MEKSDIGLNQSLPKVGIVGVGLLGNAIADRLIRSGFAVAGYDPVTFQVKGIQVCNSIIEVLQFSDAIILCLPNSDVSSQSILEVRDLLTEHHTLIDSTTGNPEVMAAIDRNLRELNVTYLEANVAGSSEQMRGGDATLFIGGHTESVELNSTIFDALSKQWFHLGAVGAASRFKLVHNMILGLNRLVLAEGLEFANSLGVDTTKALEILKQTPAYSSVMDNKGERMVHSDYQNPQARLSQHLKDVRLMIEQAKKNGAQIPLTTVHQHLLEQVEKLGLGASDNSAIIEAFKSKLNGQDPA